MPQTLRCCRVKVHGLAFICIHEQEPFSAFEFFRTSPNPTSPGSFVPGRTAECCGSPLLCLNLAKCLSQLHDLQVAWLKAQICRRLKRQDDLPLTKVRCHTGHTVTQSGQR